MPSTAVALKDIQSWVPAYDPRRLAKTAIMSGQNFLHGSDGPTSAFGSSLADYNKWGSDSVSTLSELKVGTEFFYGTPTGVYRLNPINRQIESILELAVTDEFRFWPWTVAFVGGVYYFAQRDIGLWQYNPLTNSVTQIDTPVGMIIRGITNSYERVIVISDTLYFWSGLDDGTDYVPSLDTGAGAQALLIGTIAYRVDALEDGFVVSTDLGICKASAVDADYVWQHAVYSKDIKIFSPNAGTIIPDVGYICIDAGGFHLLTPADPAAGTGSSAQLWEGDMSEYIKNNQIKAMNKAKLGCMGMYFSHASRCLYVYFAPNVQEGVFNQTFVWYMPSSKWGPFSARHLGFLETYGSDNSPIASYADTDGYLHSITGRKYCETQPIGGFSIFDFLLRKSVETDALIDISADGKIVMNFICDMRMADSDPTQRLTWDGVFLTSPFTPFGPYNLPQAGLNSRCEIGPFRFADSAHADATSQMSELLLGMSRGDIIGSVEDYNSETGSEDYNNDTLPNQDFGTYFIPDDFNVQLISNDDGLGIPFEGPEDLLFSENIGSMIQAFPQGKSALFHRLAFIASDPGQYYSVKTIDAAGQPSGGRY